MAIEPMYFENDYRLAVGPVKAKDVLSGVPANVSGLTDLEVFVSSSRDKDAVAVHASLHKTMAEFGTTAKYAVKFDGVDITAHLVNGATYYFIILRNHNVRVAGSFVAIDPRLA